MKNKKYIGCKSWDCKSCKHYVKFLSVSSMQDICWNKAVFFEPITKLDADKLILDFDEEYE